MYKNTGTVTRNYTSNAILTTNSVIRNTYILLSATLGFSAITAWFAMVTYAQPMGLMSLLIYFGLFYVTTKLKDSVWGIAAVFALTGFLGYTLGPMLNYYISEYVNGSELIATSLGLTAIIFFTLSGYALSTKKDFSYLGGFLMVGIMVAFIASIAGLFFHIPALQLAVSAGFVLISSGMILYETSQIIHGGERNYIMATISLYVSLYNLFISLLHILAAFSGRRN
ncbi:MAG: BAX inhibitor protein [Legionellales bacterium]|nr:MAG: BAX inhibitor protein [Legionellales bacterium]